jgi:hypothetical protein
MNTTDKAVLVGGISVLGLSVAFASYASSDKAKSSATSTQPPCTPSSREYPEEIKNELHSRVKTFFSEEGFRKLQESFVIVSHTYRFSLLIFIGPNVSPWFYRHSNRLLDWEELGATVPIC